MKKLLLLLIAASFHLLCYAQDQVISFGDVKKVVVKDNRLDLQATHGYARIQVYSPSIVRVRISRQPFKDDFSYAVVAQPVRTVIDMKETAEDIRVNTDSLKLVIRKRPFSIHFLTPGDQIINEDEPGLQVSWVGTEVTTYKHLQEKERFIALGEKTGNLDRRGNAYTNWNSDVYGYSIAQDPLYSTIPFYIGIHHGLQYGIFFDNTYQSDFNFGASNNRFSSFGARGGEMNYYFIYHRSVSGIIRSYTDLTGRMNLPPDWSLGYQQNRYSYYPEAEVFRIAHTLREKDIPADGITLDIHYMDAYKLFTWNKERFPAPGKMIDSLGRMGFKTTLIVDPGIKVEKGYPAYESGLKENIFLKYPDGENYTGEVWPGWCHFPDFTSEKGRDWWRRQVTNYTSAGVAGLWNDMNEISTWGQKMPSNVLFNYDGHPTIHGQAHNVYGLEMARSSYEGARNGLQKRPFILTRAGYAGLQRYTALWTGDNRAEDDHMLAGVRLITSLGLSGVAFTGMDVGGFTGNGSAALNTRWMQLGAFLPYFRSHTAFNTRSAEPWSFGEDNLDIIRNYIKFRYRLLPYLYSTFYEATQDGMPVARSLAIDYTQDDKIYDPAFQNQYLFGPSFLVMPQESLQRFARVYLPAGDWYDLYSGAREQGGREKIIGLSASLLPVYVKAGSIIPMQSVVSSTIEKPSDTIALHVYNGAEGNSFTYYEDDGETYRYEKGSFYKRTIVFDPAQRNIILGKVTGDSPSRFHHLLLVLHGFEGDTIRMNANVLTMTASRMAVLDDERMAGIASHAEVRSLVLDNDPAEITIGY